MFMFLLTHHAVAALTLREEARALGRMGSVERPLGQARSDDIRVNAYDVGEGKVSVGPE